MNAEKTFMRKKKKTEKCIGRDIKRTKALVEGGVVNRP